MRQYLDLVRHCLEHGEFRGDRTGTGTFSCFGGQIRFNLGDGFPLVTAKKVKCSSVIHELLWFIRGSTNVKELQDLGVHIWDEWATDDGELGPVYGRQWRSWPCPDGRTVDQLEELMRGLKERPFSRRHIISAWNVADLPEESQKPHINAAQGKMALPPCHALFQFYVSPDNKLSCQLYQRSADLFLGVPFNIASYALFTMMIAHTLGFKLGEFIHTFGDYHIYSNHQEQVKTMISREPKTLPKMVFTREVPSIYDFRFEDFDLQGYDPHPFIKAPIAV